MRKTRRKTNRPNAIELAPIEAFEAAALKAINAGEATPEQQHQALEWIIKKACGIGMISFDPENAHATSFNEGKRFVGVQLVAILAEPMDNFNQGVKR